MNIKTLNIMIIIIILVNLFLVFTIFHRYKEGTLKEKLEFTISEIVYGGFDWKKILFISGVIALSIWLFREFSPNK